MKMFGQATPCQPVVPDQKVLDLRCRLLVEEVIEFCQGAGFKVTVTPALCSNQHHVEVRAVPGAQPDLIEMVDGLGDIKYVQEGAAVSLGVDMEPIDTEVHRSNMSKFWKKSELDKVPEDCTVTAVGINMFVVKRSDGKVIKSPSFSAPDFRPILDEQTRSPLA